MKETPIIFSTQMVRAIIEGRKTQTRRIIKPQPTDEFNPNVGNYYPSISDKNGDLVPGELIFGASDENEGYKCPYGQPGDLLWVRETFLDCKTHIVYKADISDKKRWKWKPSIYMPKSAARLWLKITDVRVERLQDISDEDAQQEGYVDETKFHAKDWFQQIWIGINGQNSWDVNPWVWVVEFKRIEKPIVNHENI